MPRLRVPEVLLRRLGRQLGGPSGPFGSLVARMLNKWNGPEIAAAVAALELTGSEEVADIGFGGGLGLDLLLHATGDGGRVHGVEPSPDMLKRAHRAHHEQVAARRLTLHAAAMQSLPISGGALDGWISLNTVYFVQDLRPAFAELRRVLAPSGRGVLGSPTRSGWHGRRSPGTTSQCGPWPTSWVRSRPPASRSSNAPCRAPRPSIC